MIEKLVPTNFVPAVAVKRREQVLLVLTGCKMCVDGFLCFK
jgi:hypothetical protein